MNAIFRLTLLAFTVCFMSQAYAKEFNSLLIFGDGYSDTGAGYKIAQANGNALIPSNLYYQHRWSNGPIWAEYVARKFDLNLKSYAVGGAAFGFDNAYQTFLDPLGGIQQQISRFSDRCPWVHNNAIVVVAAGPENLAVAQFQNGGLPQNVVDETVQDMLGGVLQTILQLQDLGAKNIVIWNAVDVTQAPIFQTELFQADSASYQQGINSYNEALPALIASINFMHPESSVYLFDAQHAFSQTLLEVSWQNFDLSAHTLTLNYGPPITSSLTGPTSGHLAWYDDKHPTTIFWRNFAPKFNDFLTTNLDLTLDCL